MGSGSARGKRVYYNAGLQFALCYSTNVRFQNVKIDGKPVYFFQDNLDPDARNRGSTTSRITVNEPDLFGGEEGQGGFIGDIDLVNGSNERINNRTVDLGQNDYLNQHIDISELPAYRKVAFAVVRGAELGTSSRPPPFEFMITREAETVSDFNRSIIAPTYLDHNGEVEINLSTGSNYPNTWTIRALLPLGRNTSNYSNPFNVPPNYIIPYSGSGRVTTRVWVRKVIPAVDYARSVFVRIYPSLGRYAHVTNVRLYVNGNDFTNNQGYYRAVLKQEANQTLDVAYRLDCHGEEQDNYMVTMQIGNTIDMNPADIIYECLTNTDFGLQIPTTDIDTASFNSVREVLHRESFGLSFLWRNQDRVDDFISNVARHINAQYFVNRATGRIELKLIRNDYNISNLITLNESNIISLTDFVKPAFDVLVNSISVKFFDIEINKESSTTVQDLSLLASQSGENLITNEYSGISQYQLANQVALRDLRELSAPLIRCKIVTTTIANNLNLGSPFILNWSIYGVSNIIMRVTRIVFGNDRTDTVSMDCVQDIFSIYPNSTYMYAGVKAVDPAVQTPLNVENAMALEMPYIMLYRLDTQNTLDDALTSDPNLGRFSVVAQAPNPYHLNFRLNTNAVSDVNANYIRRNNFYFNLTGTITSNVTKIATSITITISSAVSDTNDLVNEVVIVNDELILVTAISFNSTSRVYTLTVTRGMYDTSPNTHSQNDILYFWFYALDNITTDNVDYAINETVYTKLQSITGSNILPLSNATAYTVTMNARAIRPYNAGNLRLIGNNAGIWDVYALLREIFDGNQQIGLSWVNRNRATDTGDVGLGFNAGNSTPPMGLTYNLRIYGEEDTNGNDRLLRTANITSSSVSYTYTQTNERNDSSSIPSLIYYLNTYASRRSTGRSGTIPYAIYTFNETANTGTVANSSVHYQDSSSFTLAHVTQGAQPLISESTHSMYFNGNSGQDCYIENPVVDLGKPNTNFTIAFWYKTDYTGGGQVLFQQGDEEDGFVIATELTGGQYRIIVGLSDGDNHVKLTGTGLASTSTTNFVAVTVRVGASGVNSAQIIHQSTSTTITSISSDITDLSGGESVWSLGRTRGTGITGVTLGTFLGRIDTLIIMKSSFITLSDTISPIEYYEIGTLGNYPSPITLRNAGRLRFNLRSTLVIGSSVYYSYQDIEHVIRRIGFGFNYGYRYGGRTSGTDFYL